MKSQRLMEKALLLVGMIAVDVWLGSKASTALFQSWEGWVFDHQRRGEQATAGEFLKEKGEQVGGLLGIVRAVPPPSAPRSPVPPGWLSDRSVVGRLTIPRLGLSAMVREGVGEDTLRLALGHIPDTALPGEKGNVS